MFKISIFSNVFNPVDCLLKIIVIAVSPTIPEYCDCRLTHILYSPQIVESFVVLLGSERGVQHAHHQETVVNGRWPTTQAHCRPGGLYQHTIQQTRVIMW
jgi:hypothetical protein